MQIRNSPEGYGAVAMALHWAVVVLLLCAWLTGQFGDALPRGPQREAGELTHLFLGLSILALAAARLCWRLADPPPPEESTVGRWSERAARAMQYVMYALLIAVPIAGIAVQFARGHGLPVFGLFEIASPWAADRNFARDVREVHEMLANAFLILAGLHAAAALLHHYLLRDRTLARMLPWSRGRNSARHEFLAGSERRARDAADAFHGIATATATAREEQPAATHNARSM
jgi:cytochrome b561